MKAIILNAAKGVGKDVGADYIADVFDSEDFLVGRKSFKSVLNNIVKAIYGISDRRWKTLTSRENKELPSACLNGKSSRQVQIEVSEQVIKPFYGKDFFGKATAKEMYCDLEVFSDGGFVEEITPLIERLGEDNILVIRVHREGYDFSGDSRSFLPDDIVPNVIDVDNNGSLGEYFEKLEKVVGEWLNESS